MPNYAVIDMGTNSIRLLLAKVEGGRIVESQKELEMTRLGKGVDETKLLSKESMDATVEAIKKFKAKAEAFGAEALKVIATSAVRDASNRASFVKRVLEETGVEIEVISGQTEAELGFKGVLAGVGSDEPILVVDIGGGSTEFIVGDQKGIEFAVSKDVGAVRMTGKHFTKDPIIRGEKEDLIQNIDEILEETLELVKEHVYGQIVGIGGTLTTISTMKQEMQVYDSKKVQNSEVTKDDIERILNELEGMTQSERQNIPGLQPKRADIIYAGITIMDRILKKINKFDMIVSDSDNLEGVIQTYFM